MLRKTTRFYSILFILFAVVSGLTSPGESHVASNQEVFTGPDNWIDGDKEFLRKHGQVYEIFNHPSFAAHSLRITEPQICDTSVQQYSGYLDITDKKHIFFWFSESRSSPSEDPLVLWMNGGPGCSSLFGLLFELGPCSVTDEGNSTTFNPYSWTNHANVIFIDQPIGTGFSYSSDGSVITTTAAAAKDVYAFLELFLRRFPQYADLPFHLAGESYAGRYIPSLATEINQHNKLLGDIANGDLTRINLESVMIGNGLVDPRIQMPSVVEFACEGPYAIYDDPFGAECELLRVQAVVCQNLIERCYALESALTCIPASEYCWQGVFGPVFSHGYNMYDARKKCNPEENGSLCYAEIGYLETYLNKPETQASLGVDPVRQYVSCSSWINLEFRFLHGDGMKNGAGLLPQLISDGIRVLIYAGNTDLMTNYMGASKFVYLLDNIFREEFVAAPTLLWSTAESHKVVGDVRSAGAGAGNLTLAIIYEAGHMVPYDQPEAALDMLTKWIRNVPLA